MPRLPRWTRRLCSQQCVVVLCWTVKSRNERSYSILRRLYELIPHQITLLNRKWLTNTTIITKLQLQQTNWRCTQRMQTPHTLDMETDTHSHRRCYLPPHHHGSIGNKIGTCSLLTHLQLPTNKQFLTDLRHLIFLMSENIPETRKPSCHWQTCATRCNVIVAP